MRVLVSGAAGFVGTGVVTHLAREHEVRALDIAAMAPSPGVETRQGDVSDWATAIAAVDGVHAIVHLASGGARPGATPPSVMADSVGATVALLEAARDAGCRRMVLMSSSAVVTGYARGTRIGPATPPRFSGLYALSKHLQEVVARQYAAEWDLEIPILRPWVVVDAERRVLRDGTPLGRHRDPLAHDGAFGWIERRDLAAACAAAVTVPIEGAPIIHLMANPIGRALFDMGAADEMLRWRPSFDFADELPSGTRVPDVPAPAEAMS